MKIHFANTAIGTRKDGSTYHRIECRIDSVDAATHAATHTMADVTCKQCQEANGAVRKAVGR